jgi:hypothetical protein
VCVGPLTIATLFSSSPIGPYNVCGFQTLVLGLSLGELVYVL